AHEHEPVAAAPARREDAFLRADEADRDTAGPERPEEPRVLLGVGDDEVRGPERRAIEGAEGARGQRAGAEAAAVLDEGVPERDERVEHDRPAACRPTRRRDVDMSRVADEQYVEAVSEPPEQPRLGRCQPRRSTE